jgi:hypothetical protein
VGNRRDIWVVLLAAGDGQHLRALTANARLDGGRSPLQISMQRALADTSRERIVIVVTEAHRRWWERELFALPRSQIVVQPSNRGTGLGFLLPLLGQCLEERHYRRPHPAIHCALSAPRAPNDIGFASHRRGLAGLTRPFRGTHLHVFSSWWKRIGEIFCVNCDCIAPRI